MKKIAIIVAGGIGNRMNTDVPKQFLLLGDMPVLMRTINCFHDLDNTIEIVVVLPENEINAWEDLCQKYSFSIVHRVVACGETRFHSVKNGLTQVDENSIVGVHDGARPFVSAKLINRCFSEAEKYGNAVPAISINESMRKVAGDQNEIADRTSFVIIQTPQCYHSGTLKSAYKSDYKNIFTDDASVVEFFGETIHLIEGERDNIKITYPVDLLIGEAILKSR